LNKHFTAVHDGIVAERAAADDALRELEHRKKSSGGGLFPFTTNKNSLTAVDRMYLELKRKKEECRRKEKSTVLLYQRYADKFGGAMPDSFLATATATTTNKGKTSSPVVSKKISSDWEERIAQASQPRRMSPPSPLLKPQNSFTSRGMMSPSPTVAPSIAETSYSLRTPLSEDKTIDSFPIPYIEGGVTEDDSQASNVSGLTSMPDGYVNEAEAVLLDFIRSETDAIKELVEEEDLVSLSSNSVISEEGIKAERATQQAEAMVRQMQDMVKMATLTIPDEKVDGKKEIKAARTLQNHGARGEEWKVYWSDEHRREYYHEIHSNIVQWDKPEPQNGSQQDDDSVVVLDFSRKTPTRKPSQSRSIISHEEVMPETYDTPRSSRRVEEYRKKLRKRKKLRRRLAAGLGALTAVGAAVWCYKPQSRVAERANNIPEPKQPTPKTKKSKSKAPRASKTPAKIVKPKIVKPKVEELKIEQPKPAVFSVPSVEEALQEEEEAAVVVVKKQEIKRRVEVVVEDVEIEKEIEETAPVAAVVVVEKVPVRKTMKKPVVETAVEVADARVKFGSQVDLVKDDPAGSTLTGHRKMMAKCFIPFSHVFLRDCRKQSKEYPLFDIDELFQSMMQ